VCLLHAGNFEVFQDHFGECLLSPVLCPVLLHPVDQFIVLIDVQHAVRAEAFNRERAGHADLSPVLVGPIVEVLELGLRGDGGVDLLLPSNSPAPPFRVQLFGSI
jgi:hypothetical protein